MNKTIIITAIVALGIGLGGGYAAAKVSAPATTSGSNTSFARGSARGLRGGNQSANGFIAGTVAKENSESLTIDTRDGNSHLVLLTPATSVFKSVAGSLTDVTIGSTVTVSGSTNSDGSISADSIQLRRTNAPATIGQ